MNISKITILPIIYSDVFISLGDTCKPALWLKTAKLRKQAMPLDWMRYYKLNVVTDILKNKQIDYFSDFTETFVENSLHRHIRCNKTQIECIHYFPFKCSPEEYLPIFTKMFTKRIKRFKDTIKQHKNICFVMSRIDDISEIIDFMQELSNLYINKHFTIINIRKNEKSNEIYKYELNKKIILYDYSFNDIHENGDDPVKNKDSWRGNTKFWTNIIKHFRLKIQTKPKNKNKYF